MSKVLTIREKDTAGVGFAVLLTKFSKEHIQRTIAKGLIGDWYYLETMAHEIATNEEGYTLLKERGSAWFADDRFEVSITALSEEPSENEEAIEEMGNLEYDKEMEELIISYSPFTSMIVKAAVDWDIDEGEEGIARLYEEEFSADSLKELGFIEEDENCPIDWKFKEEKFKEWFSDHISDETGYCHNGFSFYYNVKR